ncbi:MAG: YfiT family bacillithiol transferase [Bacteroidota bacterium]
MTDQELEKLRYPIGRFSSAKHLSPEEREVKRSSIRLFPARLRAASESLNDEQLDTPYRPGGWTIRQVIHHVVDSHMNSYVRFRWTLTEDEPVIKAYDEKAWALLPDAKSAPVSFSLDLLHHLHIRWMLLLDAMGEEEYQKRLEHPVSGHLTLDEMLALYAWHCDHHLAHVTELKKREAWA